MRPFTITTPRGPRTIGPGHPAFLIAELSGNHRLDFDLAVRILDEAIDAGVDAIKLQTYTADTLTIDCDAEPFQVRVNDAWSGKTLHQLYKGAYTPWEWQPELKRRAEARGVPLFSTPFDESAVDFLESMGVVLHKVASFEIGHLPLLKKIGRTRKPVILSRGLATQEEVARAIRTLRDSGSPDVAVLHCVSSYPARHEQMNLRTIPDLAARFDVVAGLSDHSLGITAAIAAVALGACIIEKHVTHLRAEGGPDAAFSLEPAEFAQLVRAVRETEAALGRPTYDIEAREAENRVFKRSVFVVRDVRKGEAFTSDNLRIIRPGFGMDPRHFETALGRSAARDLPRGTPLRPDDLVPGLDAASEIRLSPGSSCLLHLPPRPLDVEGLRLELSTQPTTLPADLRRDIDAAWEQARIRNPRLFDGGLLNLRSLRTQGDGLLAAVEPIDYRTYAFLRSLRDYRIFDKGVAVLGLSVALFGSDRQVILAVRGRGLSGEGAFHTVPGGLMTPSQPRFRDQVLDELREELAVLPHEVRDLRFHGIGQDARVSKGVEFLFSLTCSLTASEIVERHARAQDRDESERVFGIPFADLPPFIREHRSRILDGSLANLLAVLHHEGVPDAPSLEREG